MFGKVNQQSHLGLEFSLGKGFNFFNSYRANDAIYFFLEWALELLYSSRYLLILSVVKFIGKLFLIIVFYHFNIHRIYSDVSSFILDILCLFSLSFVFWSVWLEIYKFCWYQKTSFRFQWLSWSFSLSLISAVYYSLSFSYFRFNSFFF